MDAYKVFHYWFSFFVDVLCHIVFVSGIMVHDKRSSDREVTAMQPTRNAMGATEIFRMPAPDATTPDLLGSETPANPTLAIVKGPQAGSIFELGTSEITLGRDPANSVFLNDMTVSRHHARIDLAGLTSGFVTIEDLGSLNGTWVDGAIVNRAMLKDGSTIQIGTFRMVFHTNRRITRIETGS